VTAMAPESDRRISMHRHWTIGTFAAAALLLAAGNAGAQYAVSQLPALAPSPPTNIVLTVDDSGSMQWAYVPDGMADNIGTRRFNAASFNALAYNPKIIYPAPVMITSAGTQQLTSSFTAAPIDGFNTAAGTVDLSTNYQPTSSYSPGSTSQNCNCRDSSRSCRNTGCSRSCMAMPRNRRSSPDTSRSPDTTRRRGGSRGGSRGRSRGGSRGRSRG